MTTTSETSPDAYLVKLTRRVAYYRQMREDAEKLCVIAVNMSLEMKEQHLCAQRNLANAEASVQGSLPTKT